MAMLAMLLPNRSPTARSGAPATAALTSVTSSGKDVAPATRSMPTSCRDRRAFSAIASPARAR